jgi:hypothetical protein
MTGAQNNQSRTMFQVSEWEARDLSVLSPKHIGALKVRDEVVITFALKSADAGLVWREV